MNSKQLLTLGGITLKTDIGFIFIAPELCTANKIEKQTNVSVVI
jgi:hypothetical protein